MGKFVCQYLASRGDQRSLGYNTQVRHPPYCIMHGVLLFKKKKNVEA